MRIHYSEGINQVQDLFFDHFLQEFLWSQSFKSNKSCLFLLMWETGSWLHAVEDVVVAPLRPKVSGSEAAAGLTAVVSATEWPGQCRLPVEFWYQQHLKMAPILKYRTKYYSHCLPGWLWPVCNTGKGRDKSHPIKSLHCKTVWGRFFSSSTKLHTIAGRGILDSSPALTVWTTAGKVQCSWARISKASSPVAWLTAGLQLGSASVELKHTVTICQTPQWINSDCWHLVYVQKGMSWWLNTDRLSSTSG